MHVYVYVSRFFSNSDLSHCVTQERRTDNPDDEGYIITPTSRAPATVGNKLRKSGVDDVEWVSRYADISNACAPEHADHTHTHTHTHTGGRTDGRTHAHRQTDTHTYTQTETDTETRHRQHTHTHTHSHTHTHAHARSKARTYINTGREGADPARL
jgi:hypothetical protein